MKMVWILGWLFFGSHAVAGTPNVKHVIHVVFENADYEDARSAPFFAKLFSEGVAFTDSHAVTHPSQPNYIAMISGDTQGVLLDNQVNLKAPHLGTLLEKKGLQWKAYAEGYPGNCFLGMKKGKYVRKHVPFLSFIDVQNSKERCGRVQNAESFFRDVKARELPEYSLFVPDLDHDGHDTSVRESSQWFSDTFGGVLQDSAIMKDTLFIITYDESERYMGSNQIYTVMIGANSRAGFKVNSQITHYSVLRMIEEIFELGTLNQNDFSAAKVPDFWE